MPLSEMQNTLQGAYEHIEDDDPQPTQVLVTPGQITMQLASIDDLLEFADTVTDSLDDNGEGERVVYIAQQLWKQADDQPAPTVITAQYNWEFDGGQKAEIRLIASSPLTMDQVADLTIDDRIEVTRSQVETLMVQGHAVKAGLPVW